VNIGVLFYYKNFSKTRALFQLLLGINIVTVYLPPSYLCFFSQVPDLGLIEKGS